MALEGDVQPSYIFCSISLQTLSSPMAAEAQEREGPSRWAAEGQGH